MILSRRILFPFFVWAFLVQTFCVRALPDGHESCAFWKDDPNGLIAYEGLRYCWGGKGPYATGDPVVMKWGPATDRGLYGSGYVGMLGSIVRPTNDERILRLDCLATDFCRPAARKPDATARLLWMVWLLIIVPWRTL